MPFTLDCCVSGLQDALWFGPMGFQCVFQAELSDADPVPWLDFVAHLVIRRRLNSFLAKPGFWPVGKHINTQEHCHINHLLANEKCLQSFKRSLRRRICRQRCLYCLSRVVLLTNYTFSVFLFVFCSIPVSQHYVGATTWLSSWTPKLFTWENYNLCSFTSAVSHGSATSCG